MNLCVTIVTPVTSSLNQSVSRVTIAPHDRHPYVTTVTRTVTRQPLDPIALVMVVTMVTVFCLPNPGRPTV
jgi:hypothetical protein